MKHTIKRSSNFFIQELEACKRYFQADYTQMEYYIMASQMNGAGGSGGSGMAIMPKMNTFKSNGTPLKRISLTEEIDQALNEAEERVAALKEAKNKVSEFENTYKKGDVVFNKQTGPSIFKRVILYREYGMDRPTDQYGNPIDIKTNELVACLSNADGEVYVPAREIVPYTESVRLLYEAERSQTD